MDDAEKERIFKMRAELEERFESNGIDDLSDEECIQLLLQYAMPGKDTSQTAKLLLDTFGSFHAVFDANFQVLAGLEGMSETSAALLKFIPQFMRCYAVDRMEKYKVFDTVEKVGEFCINHYFGETEEILSVILLGENKRFIGFRQLQRGGPGSASLNLEKLAECIFVNEATSFILVHNHNNGSVQPSAADIDTTYFVREYFMRFDMPLVEHIIVSNDHYFPLVNYLKGYCKEEDEAPDGDIGEWDG